VIAIVSHAGGAVLPVLAHPGSKRNGILGERAGAVRVAVTSPPEKGQANDAIRSVLAEYLGCKAGDITLLSGARSRRKRFLVAGLGPDELNRRLMASLGDSRELGSDP
jgi:uncharacterized protein (TIGR00251 family)